MLYLSLKRIVTFLLLPHASQPLCSIITQLPMSLAWDQLAYGTDPNIVYLIGGITGTNYELVDSIYKWNVTTHNFIILSVATATPCFFSKTNNAVSFNDRVYFVGIDDNQWDSGIVYIFDIITETWMNNSFVNTTPYPAIYGCVTANATHLFFIGGEIAVGSYLDRLRIYDTNSNIWSHEQIDIAPIKDNGWSSGFCQHLNDKLYVFGGKVGVPSNQNQYYYRIDEIFKWDSQKWSIIGYLPYSHANGIAVHHNDNIYLIGGFSDKGPGRVTSIYQFDTNIEEIVKVYNMTQALVSPSAVIISHKLYIFGGVSDDGTAPVDAVQRCDIDEIVHPATSTTNEAITTDVTTSVASTQSLTTYTLNTSYTTIASSDSKQLEYTTEETGLGVSITNTFVKKSVSSDINSTVVTIYANNSTEQMMTSKEYAEEDNDVPSAVISINLILVIAIVAAAVISFFVSIVALCMCCYRKRQSVHVAKEIIMISSNTKTEDNKRQNLNQTATQCIECTPGNIECITKDIDEEINTKVEGFQWNVVTMGEVEQGEVIAADNFRKQTIIYNMDNDGDQEVIDDGEMTTSGR